MIAAPSLIGRSLAELPRAQLVFRAIENRAAIVAADVAYNSAAVEQRSRAGQPLLSLASEQERQRLHGLPQQTPSRGRRSFRSLRKRPT